jgi:hypothetical protein
MGLRIISEIDLGEILEDSIYGFGWPITVVDPGNVAKLLTGFSNDISQIIDPDTGQVVSGRLATVALRITSLVNVGFANLPVGIADSASKPWLVKFDDINLNSFTFKVAKSDPDRVLGIVICTLELYKP